MKPINAIEKNDQDIIHINKGEKSPYEGVLVPPYTFSEYERNTRALLYMEKNPPECDDCECDGYFQSGLFGFLLGVIITGYAVAR